MVKLRIRHHVKRRKLTHRAFARQLGMTERNAYKLYEPGYNPTVRTLARVAKVLRLKIRDLIDE